MPTLFSPLRVLSNPLQSSPINCAYLHFPAHLRHLEPIPVDPPATSPQVSEIPLIQKGKRFVKTNSKLNHQLERLSISMNPNKSTSTRTAQTGRATPKSSAIISSAPMCSAPMVYNADGSVAWEQMWDSFCALATAGGPPHRAKMLEVPAQDDPTSAAYQRVGDELIRGIQLVSGMAASHATPGWLAVKCKHAAHARWMSEQIAYENVQCYAEGDFIYLPVASTFALTGEIKNVITVVAKTSHYWEDHVLNEVKTLMAWESRIVGAFRALRPPPKSSKLP